jgi:hypothetical protein
VKKGYRVLAKEETGRLAEALAGLTTYSGSILVFGHCRAAGGLGLSTGHPVPVGPLGPFLRGKAPKTPENRRGSLQSESQDNQLKCNAKHRYR